jgi:hypothetical protein
MKSNELNHLVKVTLNPPIIAKIVIHHTIEEIEKFTKDFSSIVSEEEGQEYENNCLDIEVNENVTYILTNKNYISKLRSLLNLCDVKYTLTNASREFFEMDDLSSLLSVLKTDEDPEFTAEFFPDHVAPREQAVEIIKSVFESNFTIDDVLDRINTNGSGSLNEFHKYLLG